MPETAVMEAPEISTPVETPEVETPEVESEPSSQPESQPEVAETAPADQDGRQFAGKLRDHYKELIASQDPAKVQLAKSLKDLFFQNKALRDKFPGGLKEIEELKTSYESLGTPEQIQAVTENAKILESIDSEVNAADPKFIDRLIEVNPESFNKLVPVALNKFAQVAPAEYQRVMSGILSSTLTQAKMGDQLYLIRKALTPRRAGEAPDIEEAMALVGGISDWMKGLDEAGKIQPPMTPQNDPRAAELQAKQEAFEDKQAEFFNRQLATTVNGWRDSQIKAALTKITGGQKIDPERMEIMQERVVRELVKLHPKDFQDTWNRHYAQGDQAVLVKFIQGIDGPNISRAVAKAHALLFPGGVRKAPVTTQAQQPTAKPAEAGWIKVSTRPNPQEIDRGRGRTTDEMIFSGKAILRSGRKVQWDRA